MVQELTTNYWERKTLFWLSGQPAGTGITLCNLNAMTTVLHRLGTTDSLSLHLVPSATFTLGYFCNPYCVPATPKMAFK